MMKTTLIALLTFATVLGSSVLAQAKEPTELQKAITTALSGKEVYPFVQNGHKFHIKPIEVVTVGDNKGVTGQLSHDINGPDEQIYYKITIKKGEPTKTEIKINNEWLPKDVSVGVHGDWRGAASQIIDTVALMVELQ